MKRRCVSIATMVVVIMVSPLPILCQKQESIPTSTQWLLNASNPADQSAIDDVCMISLPKKGEKGTGFIIEGGYVVTNEHVIRGNTADEIIAISSYSDTITFTDCIDDPVRDIAVLIPTRKLEGGLKLGDTQELTVGSAVVTWGYPLGYNGPAPLLTVGYLSGFLEYPLRERKTSLRRFVVNGAFNPGNSGGPLFRSQDNRVIGIVVSKHAPISSFLLSALKALSEAKSGLQFTATNDRGVEISFSEAQIVAEFLKYFRQMTQVVIGEAVDIQELKDFLKEKKL